TNKVLGQRSGAETHTLSPAEMPMHNHAMMLQVSGVVKQRVNQDDGSISEPENAYYAISDALMYDNTVNHVMAGQVIPLPTPTITLAETGGNTSFSLIDPCLALRYIICYNGTYPSRP